LDIKVLKHLISGEIMKMVVILISLVFCVSLQAKDKIYYENDEQGSLTVASKAAS